MKSTDILGVRVDKVGEEEAADLILNWVKGKRKKYVVTPNIEIIMAARRDPEFLKVLNEANLAIPDSSHLGWAERIIREKSFVKKMLLWPLFLLPGSLFSTLPTTTGTDLMESLIALSKDQGFTIGLLGGKKRVAERTAECLLQKYPGAKINFVSDGGMIDRSGNQMSQDNLVQNPADILFVAFGHVKQEKWIAKNMDRVDAKVFMGVGGAFDYISGEVKRAPGLVRALGLEWLFRLTLQPWRIKRFGSLIEFMFLTLKVGSKLDRKS